MLDLSGGGSVWPVQQTEELTIHFCEIFYYGISWTPVCLMSPPFATYPLAHRNLYVNIWYDATCTENFYNTHVLLGKLIRDGLMTEISERPSSSISYGGYVYLKKQRRNPVG